MTIETIAIIGATATVVAGFGGAALGSYFTYLSGVKLIQKTHAHDVDLARNQEFNRASTAFRAAFVNEVFLVRHNIKKGDKSISDIITDQTLVAHGKAKILFETFLSSAKLEGFNVAWEKYKNSENDYYNETSPPSNRPSCNPTSTESRKDFSQYCLNHINSLLEYAKLKK